MPTTTKTTRKTKKDLSTPKRPGASAAVAPDPTSPVRRGRRAAFSEERALKVAVECGGSKKATSLKLGCSRTTLDTYIKKYPTLRDYFEGVRLGHLDEAEDTLYQAVRNGNLPAAMFVLKTQGRDRGWVEGKQMDVRRDEISGDAKAIFADLLEHKCTAAEAALRFDSLGLPLPDSVRLLLAKEVVEAPDPTDGQYAVISAEEMAERAKARLAEIRGQQTDFLPQRQREVAELKEELSGSDSFHPQQ